LSRGEYVVLGGEGITALFEVVAAVLDFGGTASASTFV
jgi:hypothetical protein